MASTNNRCGTLVILGVAFLSGASLLVRAESLPAAIARSKLKQSYTFTATNNGDTRILRLEAAERGKNDWGSFEDSAIRPGETVNLEWDDSLNNTSCYWKIRAIYADGSTSKPATFNFCERLELVFD